MWKVCGISSVDTSVRTKVLSYILSSYGSTFVRKYLWFVGLSLKTQSIIHLITSHHIKSCIQIEERSTSLRLRRPETPSFDTYIRVGSPEDDLKMTVTNFFSCYFYALTNISAQYYELYRGPHSAWPWPTHSTRWWPILNSLHRLPWKFLYNSTRYVWFPVQPLHNCTWAHLDSSTPYSVWAKL